MLSCEQHRVRSLVSCCERAQNFHISDIRMVPRLPSISRFGLLTIIPSNLSSLSQLPMWPHPTARRSLRGVPAWSLPSADFYQYSAFHQFECVKLRREKWRCDRFFHCHLCYFFISGLSGRGRFGLHWGSRGRRRSSTDTKSKFEIFWIGHLHFNVNHFGLDYQSWIWTELSAELFMLAIERAW